MVNMLWIANPILYFGTGAFTGYVLESNKIQYSSIDVTIQIAISSIVGSSQYSLSKRAKRTEETGDIIFSNMLGSGLFYAGDFAGRGIAKLQNILPTPSMLV